MTPRTMRKAPAIFALCAFSACANELPNTPAPKLETIKLNHVPLTRERTADWKFWTVTGTLGASAVADYLTTSRALTNPTNYEKNPLLGRHPSNTQLATFGASYFAGETLLAYGLKKYGQRHHWARFAWAIEPTYSTVNHAVYAQHNSTLRSK